MNGYTSPFDSALTRTRLVDDRGASGSSSSGVGGGNRFYLPAPTPFYQRPSFSGSGGAMGSSPAAAAVPPLLPSSQQAAAGKRLLSLSTTPIPDIDVSAVVPPVTVVIEGRSICQRVHLHKHTGYEGLAAALRRMFVDTEGGTGEDGAEGGGAGLDLSNAVPGYVVAYEDMEDDLLLAGDLEWKDFVRAAKRIRLLPAKSSRRRRMPQQDQLQQQPPSPQPQAQHSGH